MLQFMQHMQSSSYHLQVEQDIEQQRVISHSACISMLFRLSGCGLKSVSHGLLVWLIAGEKPEPESQSGPPGTADQEPAEGQPGTPEVQAQ